MVKNKEVSGMRKREVFAWTAVWSGIFAVVGVAVGILMVGSPAPAPAVPHSTPAAVVQPLDASENTTVDTPAPQSTPDMPSASDTTPTVTDTTTEAPSTTTVTAPPVPSTEVALPPVDSSDRNPPAGAPPITVPQPTEQTNPPLG